jgi:type IV pilus assembly protein PilN
MLVEINLLPKKESRNRPIFVLAGLLLFLLIIGLSILFFIGYLHKNETKAVDQQIQMTKQLVAAEQQKVIDSGTSDSGEDLQNAVQWAEDYPLKTVPLLRKLTELLPESGLIQSLDYQEASVSQIVIQFDTSREAAYYLRALLDSDWVVNAKILSLTTEEQDTENGLGNDPFIPRYYAEFEIDLNQTVLKAETLDQQGGEQE